MKTDTGLMRPETCTGMLHLPYTHGFCTLMEGTCLE
jgi:hypothetical protein